MRQSTIACFGGLVACALLAMGPLPAAAQGSGSATLDAARGRGQVLCGISGQVPGFSLPDSQGVMRGIDADYCRAVTAAALRRRDQGEVRADHNAEPLHRAAVGRGRSCCRAAPPGPWGATAISASNSPG